MAGGPDLLTAVLGIGLAVVAAVALVGGLILRAARRRSDEPTRRSDAREIVDHRASARVRVRMPEDPIVAAMGLQPRRRPRGRKR